MVTTEGLNPKLSAIMGNVLNPTYAPNMLSDYPHPYSFKDRFLNLVLSIIVPIFWDHFVLGPQQSEVQSLSPKKIMHQFLEMVYVYKYIYTIYTYIILYSNKWLNFLLRNTKGKEILKNYKTAATHDKKFELNYLDWASLKHVSL